MKTDNNQLIGAAKVSLGMLALLLVGSIVFFRERIFTDSALIAFNIINTGNLQIQCERYGSFITQICPVIAAHLHLPLKAILIIYSASFPVFYLATAGLLFYKFKDYALVILMGLYYSLYVSQSYFWTNNELHQGICWMFLMYGATKYFYLKSALTKRFIDSVLAILIFLLLAFLAIFTHPGVIFPLLFLWVFFWMDGTVAPFNNTKSVFFFLLIILGIFALKIFHSTNNWYDGQLTTNVLSSSPADIVNTFTGKTADKFWERISQVNWLLPIIFIVSIVTLIRRRKYLLLSYLIVASVGYFIVLCLTFKLNVDYYLESEFAPFTIFGASVFVYYIVPTIKKSVVVTMLFVIIFLVRTTYILIASQQFNARVKRVDEVLVYMNARHINKMVLLKENGDFDKEISNTAWGLSFESMLQSKLNGDEMTKTFLNIDSDALKARPLANPLKEIRTDWNSYPTRQLNRRYFSPDTLTPYVTKTYSDVFTKR